MNVRAAVPSGAAGSPAALRQAYIDAVKSRNPAAFEALFDLTVMLPDTRATFRKNIDDFDHKIKEVVLKDPEPKLEADYARYNNAFFPRHVIKTLRVTFVPAPGKSDASEYYIGSDAGRYYFVSAVQATK